MPSSAESPWTLRLFLSADLVGSTAYKLAQSEEMSPDWAVTFEEFFDGFPRAMGEAYDSTPADFPSVRERALAWKFVGDEVLLSTPLFDHREVATHLRAFQRAVKRFPQRWGEKAAFRLKAAAWLAGFPMTNRQLRLPSGVDYIGPSMDLGFRLAECASSGRCVLSADLATMFLDAMNAVHRIDELYFGNIVFEGRRDLRGVAGGPYPLLWLDMRSDMERLEDNLLGVGRGCSPNAIREFLKAFFDNDRRYRLPFIAGDADPTYGRVPPEFVAAWEQLSADEASRQYRSGPPLEGDPSSPAPADLLRKTTIRRRRKPPKQDL